MSHADHYSNYLLAVKEGHYEEAEMHITSALKEVYLQPDQTRSIEALTALGHIYLTRGLQSHDGDDFTKAVSLFNAALRRCDVTGVENEDMENQLWTAIKKAERSFLELLTDCNCYEGGINSRELDMSHRKQLADIRGNIERMLMDIDSGSLLHSASHQFENTLNDTGSAFNTGTAIIEKLNSLAKYISAEMKQFVKSLIMECIDVLGSPPCKYAILGLGSMARDELTPYSDLEFAILVKEDIRIPSVAKYFQNLTDALHIKILNLGETVLPSMYIKSLNNFESPDPNSNWFYDHITPRGLSFDGAMPWACKTPKGRKPTSEKPWTTQLIQTPLEMAAFQSEDAEVREGYRVADVLRAVCLIAGDEQVVNEYLSHVKAILSLRCDTQIQEGTTESLTVAQARALTALREDHQRYNMFSDIFHARAGGKLHNVKQELYRLPSTFISSLGLYFGIESPRISDIVFTLCKNGIISSRNMEELSILSAIAFEMRVKAYITQRCQRENSTVVPLLNIDSDAESIFFAENDTLIFRFYQIAIPLGIAMKNVLCGEEDIARIFMDVVLYDNSWYTQGHIYYRLLKLEKAKECLQLAMVEDPKDIQIHIRLSTVLGDLNLLEEAAGCIEKALDIFENDPKVKKYDMWHLYHSMGLTLSNLGREQWDMALYYLQMACDIRSREFGYMGAHINIPTLITMGYVYSNRGDFQKSDLLYNQCLKAMEELGIDCSRDVFSSIVFNNKGMNAMKREKYDEAQIFHEKSLAIRKRYFGNVCHPLIAVNVNALSHVYIRLQHYTKALPLLKEYMRMTAFVPSTHSHHNHYKLNNIGVICMKQGYDNNAALQMFVEARNMYDEMNGSDHIKAVIYNNIGYAYSNLGQIEKAETNYRKALEEIEKHSPIKERSDMYAYKARFTHNFGVLMLQQLKYQESLQYFRKALAMRTDISEQKTIHLTKTYLALIYLILQTESESACVIMGEEAKRNHFLAYAKELHYDHVPVLNNLGRIYCFVGEFTKSISQHKQALDVCTDLYKTVSFSIIIP